jgi:nitroreductase
MIEQTVLEAIRGRRVVRRMTCEPLAREQLEAVVSMARWAPSAGNRRLQRFVVVQDPTTLRLLRMVSPGMLQQPAALVLICIDWDRVSHFRLPRRNTGVYVDVGTAMQTLLLAAHAVGLAAGPVSSFSKAAVRVLLNLPDHLSPEVMVCLGHAAPDGPAPMRPRKLDWRELVHWERL